MSMSSSSTGTSLPHTPIAYDYFHYSPNLGASVFLIILFALAAVIVSIPTYKHGRGTWFMYIVTGTGIAEVIGFIARAYLADHIDDPTIKPMGSYVLMSTLLIISPNALALVNYLTLGRLLTIASIPYPPFLLRPKVVSSLFLLSDVCAFAIQGGASGMLVNKDPTTAHNGQSVMMAGLSIQIVFFSIFTFATGCVQYSANYSELRSKPNVDRVLRCLWITIAMLYIRSVFRLIEFGSGFDGPVATNEALMYFFDAIPVLSTFGAYAYYHFGCIKDLYLTAIGSKVHINFEEPYQTNVLV